MRSMCNKTLSSIAQRHTRIQLGDPTCHKFTLPSSPPVAITLPDLWPSDAHVIPQLCPTNSSGDENN